MSSGLQKILLIDRDGTINRKSCGTRYIEKLSDLNIKTVGEIFYVSYNSPYKVFGRRNEVMVEIDYTN